MQLTTATKRLSTTFGEEKGFLGQPEGSFQDLTRFIIAAAYSYSMHKGRAATVKATDLVDWQTHQYNEGGITKALCCCWLASAIAALCNTLQYFTVATCCDDLLFLESPTSCMLPSCRLCIRSLDCAGTASPCQACLCRTSPCIQIFAGSTGWHSPT